MSIIIGIVGLCLPIASLFLTVAQDKRDGVNGW